jgi:hypothetical protein
LAELSGDISRLVGATANRLRLVQVDFADEDAATREEYLLKELKAALEQVPHLDRRSFLDELAQRFPTWQQKPQPPKDGPAPQPEPMDLISLLRRLAEHGQKLSESQRRDLLGQLGKAWGITAKAEAAEPPPQGWRSKLALAAGDQVDAARATELFSLLVDFVQALDPLVTKTWKGINANANNRRTDWTRAMARYVRGDRDAAVPQELLELRQLTAALTNVLPQLGHRLHQRHLLRFRPADIEEAVRVEGGVWPVGLEAKCWRKYAKLAAALEESPVEAAISQVIIELVEPILKGSAKTATGE